MEDRKINEQNKVGQNNDKFEVASELGIVEAGLQDVKTARLAEEEVKQIVSRYRHQIIGFK